MKGGSREAKGHKSTRGKRTWYGKQETRKCCVTAMRSISRAQALEVKNSAKFGEKNRVGI